MVFRAWYELLDENFNSLNREFSDGDLQELFKHLDEIQKKNSLTDNKMAILLIGFVVIKLKLPLREEQRQQKAREEQSMLEEFENYLKGQIDRT